MDDFDEQKMMTADSFYIFGDSFFYHPSPEILTKHNIKETDSKGNIWCPFYITEGEGSGGG